ncbi:hypothetical protein DFAR_3220005 [Desulfarculales bacterium]
MPSFISPRAWPLIYRPWPCARPCSNRGYHASSTSTTAQPSALTTWKRSTPLCIAQKTGPGGRLEPQEATFLIIDEASFFKLQVLAEVHTITQFQGSSKPILPIILAGQNNLAELCIYRIPLLLASRVLAKSHLAGVSLQNMQAYLLHHLKIVGVKQNLFSDQAVTAIQQGSSGLFRKANHLARGAIIAAA